MKSGKLTLATKFAALFGAFAIVVSALVCTISYQSYKSSMLELYGNYAVGAAKLAASILEPEKLKRYAKTLETDKDYWEIGNQLQGIRENMGLKYVYVQMPISDTKYMYIYDIFDPSETEGEDTSLGATMDYDKNFEMAKLAMLTGEPTRELDITDSKYGYLASAYVPLKDSSGVLFAYVGVDISMDYIVGFLLRYLSVIVYATAMVIVVCFTCLFLLVGRSVVKPIRVIASKTDEFIHKVRDEDFEEIRTVSNDEIGELTSSVNEMFREIRDFTYRLADETAKRERAQSELDTARAIQEGILPRIFPPFENFPNADIFAIMKAAKDIGGDFYDFFVLNDHKIAAVIADVSGKGVPAALFMMVSRTLIKNMAISGGSPHEVLYAVNNQLCQNNDADMFVTTFIGFLDLKNNVMLYANAGHNPPILIHDGRADWMSVRKDFVLAGMEDIIYESQEIEFGGSDMLFLYTDGVTEAMNAEKELFGDERLLEKIREAALAGSSPKEVIVSVSDAVSSFTDGAEQSDDITMLAVRLFPG